MTLQAPALSRLFAQDFKHDEAEDEAEDGDLDPKPSILPEFRLNLPMPKGRGF